MNFDKTTLVFFVIVVNLFGAAMSQADEKADAAQKERADILEAVWSRLETGDSWQAAALVESKGRCMSRDSTPTCSAISISRNTTYRE